MFDVRCSGVWTDVAPLRQKCQDTIAPTASRSPLHRKSQIANRTCRGFTLLEVVLVVALLGLLMLLGITAMEGSLQTVTSRESLSRLSSLIRAARAQAALDGRTFHLSFDPDTGQPIISCEADPLKSPNVFVPYDAWWANQSQLPQGVSIAECQLVGASVGSEMPTTTGGDDAPKLATVTFYPDGSSDTCRLIVVCSDPDHPWQAEIYLNGIDGTITTTDLVASEE